MTWAVGVCMHILYYSAAIDVTHEFFFITLLILCRFCFGFSAKISYVYVCVWVCVLLVRSVQFSVFFLSLDIPFAHCYNSKNARACRYNVLYCATLLHLNVAIRATLCHAHIFWVAEKKDNKYATIFYSRLVHTFFFLDSPTPSYMCIGAPWTSPFCDHLTFIINIYQYFLMHKFSWVWCGERRPFAWALILNYFCEASLLLF